MAGVEDVWPPVAEAPAAIVIPTAPISRMELVAVGVLVGDTIQPLIPVYINWEWLLRVGRGLGTPAVSAARFVHVGGDASDVFDDAGFAPCLKLEIVGTGMPLVAHLRGDTAACGEVHHALALAKGVGEWFFAVDVLAERHGQHGDGEVCVVGGGDDDCVDLIAHCVEHLAEVSKCSSFVVWVNIWELATLASNRGDGAKGCECCLGVLTFQVHIAQGDDITQTGLHTGGPVGDTPVADADQRYIDFFAGGEASGGLVAQRNVGREDRQCAEGGG